MFAKGPRFPPEKPSDVPGPGHYKLPDEFRYESYKKGAFLEKADRFGAEKGSDMPGPGSQNTASRDSNPRGVPSKPALPSHGLTHLQQEIEALNSQIARLLREHQQAAQKYENKLSHNENTIKSLVKDNVALQSQVSTQQKEYRVVCQRETALRVALEKAESVHKNQVDHARKFAALQRRTEDTEKLHADDRKKHQSEIEHLKVELSASRKAITEQNERSSSLRKQLETSESRMKDLKKAIIGDQTEIKELRTKLHDAEQAKSQADCRQTDLDRMRKTLQSLETKHKTELVDKEAKLEQLAKALANERRRREILELQVHESQTKVDTLTEEASDRYRRLEGELEKARQSIDEASSSAVDDAVRLGNLQAVMSRVAQAYGRLVDSSVSRAAYRQLQLQYGSLQLRRIQLERRLADHEEVTMQLEIYCRQISEEKVMLTGLLLDAEKDIEALSRGRVVHDDNTSPTDISLICAALDVNEEIHQSRGSIAQSDILSAQALAAWYQSGFEDALVAYASADRESVEQGAVTARLLSACSSCQAEVDVLQLEHRAAETALSQRGIEIAESAARERVLGEQLADHRSQNATLEGALTKEREMNARLAHTARQTRNNEEALHLEIDKLAEELQDVMRYKEAHADLLAEVVELIQRNELAEAEAERLSKFNAEILGHTNPHQKIFYVDRIRRELADTKLQLLKSTRSRDDLIADNTALQHEVAAYKSIAVSEEYKPRNDRIRVERFPLIARSTNALTPSIAFEFTPPDEEQIDTSPMTLDEIM